MNIKAFFVDALGGALDLGIGSPDDVIRHVTPELLARHLPRPLWARLLTACLGAARVDAQLVVETIGVPNLCEHLPGTVIWACIAEIGARSVGQAHGQAPLKPIAAAVSPALPLAPAPEKRTVLAPPPDVLDASAHDAPTGTTPAAPSVPANEPLADLITELEQDERPIAQARPRTPTGQRFRQSNTNLGLRATQQRRPQAAAPATPAGPPTAPPRSARRMATEADADGETTIGSGEWRDNKKEIAVDDSQLVDWQSTETTQATDEDFSDIGRKR